MTRAVHDPTKPHPVAGDIWEQRGSQGRAVKILGVEWRTYRFGERVHEVTYRTEPETARTQTVVADCASFGKRFRRRIDPTEGLDL